MYRIARGNLERLEAERRRRVAANPATEPRNGTKNISAEASFRLVEFGPGSIANGAKPGARTRCAQIWVIEGIWL
jgi:hypothetical protein